jgi:DNA-directed RNA polymerase subunit RPC12/RpoP
MPTIAECQQKVSEHLAQAESEPQRKAHHLNAAEAWRILASGIMTSEPGHDDLQSSARRTACPHCGAHMRLLTIAPALGREGDDQIRYRCDGCEEPFTTTQARPA